MWNIFGRADAGRAVRLPRLHLNQLPSAVYAIGDVHGCLDELKRLEHIIVADAPIEGPKLIVMLGDYVDRGPQSAQVLDWLLRPAPSGFTRICLRGNHEAMFLAALERPERCDDWLTWGGEETLQSYGLSTTDFAGASGRQRGHMLQSVVPEEHRSFLRELPTMLEMPGVVFVHAGIRPGIPLERQVDRDLIWIREPFLSEDHGLGVLVVHGHTPNEKPVVLDHRIGVDTLAYSTGVLTAFKLSPGGRSLVSTASTRAAQASE